jgi:sulfite reductase (NADPH) hemoprotein beta-component
MSSDQKKILSEVEGIKERSNFLRGTLVESLADETTGAIAADDTTVIKFHGTYQQFDRELESERKRQKLEPLYSFMIRVRLPGGVSTSTQWSAMNALSDKYGNSTMKLTTRQTFQLHGIFKRNLKATIKEMNDALMDTIAACGDVNRNVMSHPNPNQSPVHAEVYETACRISKHLLPKTTAYHEIWLDKKLVAGGQKDEEPIYGKTYLPRKFKIALVIPPNNDSDVFANDLGFIAIVENNKLVGYNVAVGGGMGMTFGNNATYPRLATVIGYISKDKVVDVAEKIVLVQRDFGNRYDRKVSRFKYTMDAIGIDKFNHELYSRTGYRLEPARPFKFESNGDQFGWGKGFDGKWSLTLFIEGGRIVDLQGYKLKTALNEIAKISDGDFRLTGNQNLIIANVSENKKAEIEKILIDNGVQFDKKLTALRQNSIACVALNTCSLAFAEAERYLPKLINKLDEIIIANGLEKEPIVIRMTGCPNGCGRPYLGEIGFVGKAPGRYNLYLGAGFTGDRLNKLYKENLNEQQILDELQPIIKDFAQNKNSGERFGDFVIRKNYVKPTLEGKDFHN